MINRAACAQSHQFYISQLDQLFLFIEVPVGDQNIIRMGTELENMITYPNFMHATDPLALRRNKRMIMMIPSVGIKVIFSIHRGETACIKITYYVKSFKGIASAILL